MAASKIIDQTDKKRSINLDGRVKKALYRKNFSKAFMWFCSLFTALNFMFSLFTLGERWYIPVLLLPVTVFSLGLYRYYLIKYNRIHYWNEAAKKQSLKKALYGAS